MSSRVAEAERYLQIDRVNMFIFPLTDTVSGLLGQGWLKQHYYRHVEQRTTQKYGSQDKHSYIQA